MSKLCPTCRQASDLPIPGFPLKKGTADGDLRRIDVATSTTWLIDGILALHVFNGFPLVAVMGATVPVC
ncbi:MAG: hypothetical protein HOE35_07150 [Candidatus Ruthia sp.]|nr:hypothetical protein [Candidatus Ruthturnera sp.]